MRFRGRWEAEGCRTDEARPWRGCRSDPPADMMEEPRGHETPKEKINMGTTPSQQAISLQELRTSTTVEVLPSADVLATLIATPSVETIILDPWYNKGVGGQRDDYHEWLGRLITEACRISNHVFVWGFPEILAYQVPNIPKGVVLVSWLTWFYKNCPSVIRGWRSAQNACLHLAKQDAPTYPEHFLNDDQIERWKAGKMRFIPGPPFRARSPTEHWIRRS